MASSARKAFFVQGNWDAPETRMLQGVVALHGRAGKLRMHSIGGLGGSNPAPFRGPFEMSDEEARSVLDRIRYVDILTSHSPPGRAKCDRAHTEEIGSVPVREYVEREKRQLVLSGHVHESRAIDRLGGSTVVNPGAFKEGNFAEVSLHGMVSVELKTDGEISELPISRGDRQ